MQLKARQSEVSYKSGEVTLQVALESRKQVLQAQKEILQKTWNMGLAVLNLRELSGDLVIPMLIKFLAEISGWLLGE